MDAVGQARQMCWAYNWVCDLDIKGLFDNLDHDLMMRAVRKHAKERWMELYSERWLKGPAQEEEGNLQKRERGAPQGEVISPLLANLFLHYAFDAWMAGTYPDIPFERYADDIICHCRSAEEAEALWSALEVRFAACRLVLHPQKTRLVYCKDTNRRGGFPNHSFDFLGYAFRPRKAVWRGGRYGVSFLPAASPKALKAIRQAIRGWAIDALSAGFRSALRAPAI